jgi:hypothetical protein
VAGRLLKQFGVVSLRVVEQLVRKLEYHLTGQSDFAIITSELRTVEVVDDRIKGKRLLEEVQRELARDFELVLRAPVLLELVLPDSPLARPGVHEVLGHYRSEPWGEKAVHTVFVRAGLSAPFFCGIAAHELAHAWERERGCLTTHRALREGFARWIEYKVLTKRGARREAERLLKIRSWKAGRAIRSLLELEAQAGVAGVLAYVRSLR